LPVYYVTWPNSYLKCLAAPGLRGRVWTEGSILPVAKPNPHCFHGLSIKYHGPRGLVSWQNVAVERNVWLTLYRPSQSLGGIPSRKPSIMEPSICQICIWNRAQPLMGYHWARLPIFFSERDVLIHRFDRALRDASCFPELWVSNEWVRRFGRLWSGLLETILSNCDATSTSCIREMSSTSRLILRDCKGDIPGVGSIPLAPATFEMSVGPCLNLICMTYR
jgi:hypothetical protein